VLVSWAPVFCVDCMGPEQLTRTTPDFLSSKLAFFQHCSLVRTTCAVAALQAAEKVRTKQEKQYLRGLKPDVFSIVYGPTKVVP